MPRSLSAASLALLTAERDRPQTFDPISGCAPQQVVETRDWKTASQLAHRLMPLQTKHVAAGHPSDKSDAVTSAGAAMHGRGRSWEQSRRLRSSAGRLQAAPPQLCFPS